MPHHSDLLLNALTLLLTKGHHELDCPCEPEPVSCPEPEPEPGCTPLPLDATGTFFYRDSHLSVNSGCETTTICIESKCLPEDFQKLRNGDLSLNTLTITYETVKCDTFDVQNTESGVDAKYSVCGNKITLVVDNGDIERASTDALNNLLPSQLCDLVLKKIVVDVSGYDRKCEKEECKPVVHSCKCSKH